MYGNPIEQIAGLAQHLGIPIEIGDRRYRQFDIGVSAFHHLGRFVSVSRPFVSRLGAHLPASPVFVADAPVGHLEGPMSCPLARRSAAHSPISRLQYSTQSDMSSGVPVPALVQIKGSAPNLTAEGDELIGAEAVGLLDAPGFVVIRNALARRPSSRDKPRRSSRRASE